MMSHFSNRILVVTPRFPFPIVAGDTLRIVNMCRALSEEYRLTLVSLCDQKEINKKWREQSVFDEIHCVYHPKWRGGLNALKALPSSTPLQVAYYRSEPFRELVEGMLSTHDLVLAHLLRAGQFVENANCPRILEMTDALSLNYERVTKLGTWGVKSLIYRIEKSRIASYEQDAIDKFDLVTLVSDVDRDYLLKDKATTDASAIEVYTNGIDFSTRPYQLPGAAPTIAFIGNMRTIHNQEACRNFATEVLPLIRDRLPEARLRIIGHATEKAMRSFGAIDGVNVTGWVDSIAEASRGAIAGMGVMTVGAGVQNKVLEYMALGLPVIANQTGIEGIDAQAGKHFLRAETADEAAESFLKLYEDATLRNTLAQRARTFVEENHEWKSVLSGFVEAVRRTMESSSFGSTPIA